MQQVASSNYFPCSEEMVTQQESSLCSLDVQNPTYSQMIASVVVKAVQCP